LSPIRPQPTGVQLDSDTIDLPRHYDRTMAVLLSQAPYTMHTYWEIVPSDLDSLKRKLGARGEDAAIVMRMYDVTLVDFNGKNANHWFDIDVKTDSGSWYVKLWADHVTYCAEVGLRTKTGRFFPLTRTNYVTTPRAGASGRFEVMWLEVREAGRAGKPLAAVMQGPTEQKSADRAGIASGKVGAGGWNQRSPIPRPWVSYGPLPERKLPSAGGPQPAYRTGPGESRSPESATPAVTQQRAVSPVSTPAHEELRPASAEQVRSYYLKLSPELKPVMESTGPDRDRRQPDEHTSNTPELRFFLSPEPAHIPPEKRLIPQTETPPADIAEPWRATAEKSSGGASEQISGASEQLGGASESAVPGRDFFFEIGTELIVYGRTRPGARVLLNNAPVAIREDGSFTLRLALPEGAMPLGFSAASTDGVEIRRLFTRVDRAPTRSEP
jgi:hypothetical protein